MKAFLFVINIIAFVGVLLWFIFEPSWESGSSSSIAFAALLSQFFWNDSVRKSVKKEKTVSQNNASEKNINIGTINAKGGVHLGDTHINTREDE